MYDFKKLAIAILFLLIAAIAIYNIFAAGMKSAYVTVAALSLLISVSFFKRVKKRF